MINFVQFIYIASFSEVEQIVMTLIQSDNGQGCRNNDSGLWGKGMRSMVMAWAQDF